MHTQCRNGEVPETCRWTGFGRHKNREIIDCWVSIVISYMKELSLPLKSGTSKNKCKSLHGVSDMSQQAKSRNWNYIAPSCQKEFSRRSFDNIKDHRSTLIAWKQHNVTPLDWRRVDEILVRCKLALINQNLVHMGMDKKRQEKILTRLFYVFANAGRKETPQSPAALPV